MDTPTPYLRNIPSDGLLARLAVYLALLPKHARKGH